jgi:hypothetical protein
MTAERLACQVPFCRRTTAASRFPAGTEWICADHWRLVDRRRRRVYARAKRQLPERPGVLAMLWSRLKAEAIEAAMGIA